MNSISETQEKSKRTSVNFSFKSMFMLMAAIMMAFATLTSCDEDNKNDNDPDEIENGGGNSRTLNANEKELAGKYVAGDLFEGYQQFSYQGYYNGVWTDLRKGSIAFAESVEFKTDGKYEFVQIAIGDIYTRGGSLIVQTGNWSVTTAGKVRISNRGEDIYFVDGTNKLNQKYNGDAVFDYSFETEDGIKCMWFQFFFFRKV